jgi:hypothetical protein
MLDVIIIVFIVIAIIIDIAHMEDEDVDNVLQST